MIFQKGTGVVQSASAKRSKNQLKLLASNKHHESTRFNSSGRWQINSKPNTSTCPFTWFLRILSKRNSGELLRLLTKMSASNTEQIFTQWNTVLGFLSRTLFVC